MFKVHVASLSDPGRKTVTARFARVPVVGDYVSMGGEASFLVHMVFLEGDPKPGEPVAYIRVKD